MRQQAVNAQPRILEVLFSFEIGGSEVFGFELARQLAARGAKVICTALSSSPGPILAKCAEHDIETVDLRIPRTNPFTRNGFSLRLVRDLRRLRLDAVHLQHFLSLNKLGLPATIAGVRRLVVTEHSLFDVSQSLAGRLRTRLNWRMATAVTVVHRDIKDYLVSRLGLPAQRVEVIPIGIDVDAYHRRDRAEVRTALGLQETEIALVFVGRLAPVKNVPGLIAAFLAVAARHAPSLRMIVVGEGEDRPACEALIAAHPQGRRVRLVGLQSDPRPYLAAGDLFVMNSLSEGTPRALLEAMAAGLPAVSTAVGGIPEILGEGRGWLVSPGDQAAIENTLSQACSDPPMLAARGVQCRDYVRRNYDAALVGAKYRHLLLG